MPSYPVVDNLLIKKSGIFDFDSVYKFIFQWFMKHKYDFHEELYKHKPGHAFGNEIEIEIAAEKKITAYYKHKMSIKIHQWDVMDIPVIKDGKKKVMTKNRMTIALSTSLETDYDNQWGKTKFRENVRNIMEKHVLKKQIQDKYQYELYKESYTLIGAIRDFLDMEITTNG